MPTYGLSINGVAAASGAAYATLHTGASSPIRLVKFGLYLTTSVATSIQIIRPANTPVATTSTLGQALAGLSPASATNFDTAWSTAPTITSMVPLTGLVLPAATSAGFVDAWRSDRPIEIPASSWLVFWNFGAGTGAVPRFNLEWDE